MNEFTTALTWLRSAKNPVVFSGAGMSAESGIPTFRGTHDSLWNQYQIEQLATPGAWQADSALVWGWYVWRMALVRRAKPHSGHLAVAAIQAHWPEMKVVTQNVDDLHERAGCKNIVHLHGELFAHRCARCAHPYTGFKVPMTAADDPRLRLDPPNCLHCGGSVRPGVVWFQESLPADAWDQASRSCSEADVMLVVGTSGVVQPAASLVQRAARTGARIIEINPETSSHTEDAHIYLQSTASHALTMLMNGLS
jgi:NAD-dependent deacetylase